MTIERPSQNGSIDAYKFKWDETGVEATLERFAEKSDGLNAEITIIETPTGALLHSARLNIMASNTRASLVKALSIRRTDVDWAGLIEQVCYLAKERWREGDPLIDLREVEIGGRPRWYLEPFIEQGGATVFFADGGTGKSILALALAMLAASGEGPIGILRGKPRPVIYLDWEADPYTHAERLGALCKGYGMKRPPEIYYRRQSAGLVEAASVIKRDVEKVGAGLVIVDSLGAARGGDPISAELTIKTFNAARSFDVPWLGIDHITKAAAGGSLSHRGVKPIGSTYTHDLARVTWSIERAEDDSPNGAAVLSMVNHKANNGRLAKPMGYEVEYELAEDGDALRSVKIGRFDIRDSPSLVKKMPMRERILAHLHNQEGSRDGEESMIEALRTPGAKRDESQQIKARISELRKWGKIVKLSGGDWGLIGN